MTLLMRDQENREIGIIYGKIAAYRELNISDDEISRKLQDKDHLSKEEAEQYIRDSK